MIANLQALRFFAALLVVMHHARPVYLDLGGEVEWILRLGHFGFSGVDVFFVISGFVMWHTTADRTGPVGVRDFAASRLIRIYPIYWLLLAAGIAVYGLTAWGPFAAKSVLHSVLLTSTDQSLHFLEVAWTLTFELYFYALFALLLLLPKLARRPLLVAGLLGTAVVNVYVYDASIRENGFLLSPFLLEFFAGALLPGLVRFGKSRGLLLALGFAAIAAIFLGVAIDERRGMQRVLGFGPAAVLVVYLAVAAETHGVFRAGRPLVLLGGASYALYLIHLTAIRGIQWSGLAETLAPLGGPTPEFGYLLSLAAMAGLSVLVYSHVEQPLLALLKGGYARLVGR